MNERLKLVQKKINEIFDPEDAKSLNNKLNIVFGDEIKEEKTTCKVCGMKTKNKFNIDFEATPICEDCANAITMQQVKYLIHGE